MAYGVGSLRIRAVLAAALVIVLGTLVLEMSRSAPRTAGGDHVSFPVFAATVPGGGELCQPVLPLPSDAARASLLIGTYGRPVPALSLRFLNADGTTVAAGSLAFGAREGYVTIPLRRPTPKAPAREGSEQVCLHVGGSHVVVLGGEAGAVGADAEVVNGKAQPGHIGLLYLRQGSESWWQLLPTLAERFGLGKASFFGTWTLPLMALLLLAVWVATVRLLVRELR